MKKIKIVGRIKGIDITNTLTNLELIQLAVQNENLSLSSLTDTDDCIEYPRYIDEHSWFCYAVSEDKTALKQFREINGLLLSDVETDKQISEKEYINALYSALAESFHFADFKIAYTDNKKYFILSIDPAELDEYVYEKRT